MQHSLNNLVFVFIDIKAYVLESHNAAYFSPQQVTLSTPLVSNPYYSNIFPFHTHLIVDWC